MPATRISAETALAAAPATNDVLPIVDVSDITDAASGTTKKITVANLFTTPTISSFTNATHNHEDAAGGGQLDSDAISGSISIAKGGTGQTTQTAAFDALSPTTTQGDTIYHNGSDNIRLAKGTALQTYRMNSGATAPEWATPVPFFQQDLAVTVNDSLGTTPDIATGSMTDGSAFFVRIQGSAALYRFQRDTNTGQYYQTHSVTPTLTIPNTDMGSIINIGLYIYLFTNDATNIVCSRFLAADLTGEQAMTVPTIGCTSHVLAWTNGTDAYVVSAQSDTTSRRWTLSGTTFTAASTATVPSGYNGDEPSSMWDGTTAYFASNEAVTVEKLTNIDGSTNSSTSYPDPLYSDVEIGSFIINIDTTKMYLGFMYAFYDEAAQVSARIRLTPMTKP